MREGWKKVGRARTLDAPIFNMDTHWCGELGHKPNINGNLEIKACI